MVERRSNIRLAAYFTLQTSLFGEESDDLLVNYILRADHNWSEGCTLPLGRAPRSLFGEGKLGVDLSLLDLVFVMQLHYELQA